MSTPELHIRMGRDGRLECRAGNTGDAPALSFDPAFFGAPDSADAQRALGRFVFSLLQGITGASGDEEEDRATATAAAPDSPGALYEQFVTLQSQAMQEYSSNMLAMAEQSLQQSAAAGFQPAGEALKDWPSIRTVADMLIARGPEKKG